MREDLLEVLAEPGTGAPLELVEGTARSGRVEEGALLSRATGRRYPIVRGIPRFVANDDYTSSFGKQWNLFRSVQIDSETTAGLSRARFDAETGYTRERIAGRWCLDAGCGAGRFAEIAADRGARLVALDLSSAVDATAETCRRFDNVDVVQGSLLDPPLRRGAFDFAYCIGVIQHTPDPPGAVRSVAEMVKPGGTFSMTIYARRPWSKLHAKYLVRPVTKRLPQAVLLRAIEASMPVLFPITDVLYRIPVLGRVARFTMPVQNWVEHTEYTRDQRYREAILDTFDALSPSYDSPMTWREVERALESAGAARWSFRSRVPIVVNGQR